MVLCTICLYNTRADMADIWQWDNKNSKQSLIPKKRPKLWFSSFAVHFVVNLELAPQKVISAHRNVFQTKKHPSCTTKMQNIAEIENIPLFLPVVYIYIYICVCVCVCVCMCHHQPWYYAKWVCSWLHAELISTLPYVSILWNYW